MNISFRIGGWLNQLQQNVMILPKIRCMDETLRLFYWNSSTSLKLSISDFS